MNIIELKQIIKEIIQTDLTPEKRGGGDMHKQQSEITPEERGGADIHRQEKCMGMWHTEEGPMYRHKTELFPYLWHIKSKDPSEIKKDIDDTKPIVKPVVKPVGMPELKKPEVNYPPTPKAMG